jgi:hypothetical protein
MASSSLPVRKVLITLGEGNSTAVADAKTFEDANPRTSLRNPKAEPFARYVTESSGSRDEIDLGASFGDVRYANYRDQGAMSVRYLTFYNPVSTRFDPSFPKVGASGALADGPIQSATFPGTCQVTRVDSATQFATDLIWAHPLTGHTRTVTRLRTGDEHQLTEPLDEPAGGTDAAGFVTLISTTSFDPPLEVGERFTYPLVGDEDSAAGAYTDVDAPAMTDKNHVRLEAQFGGYCDAGGTLDPDNAGWGTAYGAAGSDDKITTRTNAATLTANYVEFNFRRLRVGQRVRLSGFTGTGGGGSDLHVNQPSASTDVASTTDFYVVRVTQGTASNKPRAYLSTTPNGAEATFSDIGNSGVCQLRFIPRAAENAMAGLQIRCLTGANAGLTRSLSHAIPTIPSGTHPFTTRLWRLFVTEDWTNVPQADDTYTILPPPAADNTAVPFDKWAYFLPACQFFGREAGLPSPLKITWDTTNVQWDSVSPSPAISIYAGCPVRLYEIAGVTSVGQAYIDKTYYAVQVKDNGSFGLSETYDGAPVNFGGSTVSALLSWEETFTRKHNPAPPGFNYSNLQSAPVAYQPFRGGSVHATPLAGQPKIAYHWGLAQRMAERLGEPLYVIDLSLSDTSLAESTVPTAAQSGGRGWHDPSSMTHWAAGPTALRDRWVRHLDAAAIAAAREGVQLEVIGVVFVQGESDAATQELADRYYANLVGFKEFVRKTLKDLGWWSKEAHELPFLQPEVYPRLQAGAALAPFTTVSAAIKRAADEDPFSKSWSTSKYTLGSDGKHYTGAGMDLMAQDAFTRLDGYVNALDVPLRICKLALSLAGEKSAITKVFPSDGSAEADLCAQFYPEARDRILEAHAWDFLVRHASLTEAATNERTDWKYAYDLPPNASGILGLGEDITSAFDSRAVKIKFSVELDSQSQRVLYANQPTPLTVRYKAKTVDARHFSATCVQAIAYLLASMIMRTVMKSEEGIKAGEAMEQRAFQMFKTAASNDSNQTRDRSQSQKIGWRRS